MVLRCSLLGHSYGESEVDREREERGSEVVLTVTEYEACQRCGERTVISENTEVTTIAPDAAGSQSAGSAEEGDGPAGTARSPPAETRSEVDSGQDTGSSGIEDAARGTEPAGTEPATEDTVAPGRTASEAASDTTSDDVDVPTDENDDPIVDDGEILDDDADDAGGVAGDRRHGEWPDSEDVGPPVGSEAEPTAWPDGDQDRDRAVAGEDAAEADTSTTDDGAADDDAVILESGEDSGSTPGSSGKQFDFSVDATPDSDAGAAADPKPDSASNAGPTPSERDPETATAAQTEMASPETGITSAENAPNPGESTLPEDANTEFYCPQCDFVATGDRGSLRTGDICPDCRKGYIGERTT